MFKRFNQFLFLFTCFIFISINTVESDISQTKNLKEVRDHLRDQYKKIALLLQTLENVLHGNKRNIGLTSIDDQKMSYDSLGQIKSALIQLSKNDLIDADPKTIIKHGTIVQKIILFFQTKLVNNIMQKILSEDFNTFISTNVSSMNDLPSNEEALCDILTIIKENDKQIELLTSSVKNLGFKWPQFAWKKFNNTPIYKHGPKIFAWTTASLLLTIFASATGWVTPKGSFGNLLKKIPGLGSYFDHAMEFSILNIEGRQAELNSIHFLNQNVVDPQRIQQLKTIPLFVKISEYLNPIMIAPLTYVGNQLFETIKKRTDVIPDINAVGKQVKKQVENFQAFLGGQKIVSDEEKFNNHELSIKNIIGQESVKEILNKCLDFIKDPERYNHLGIEGDIASIFQGHFGTGKTYAVDAFIADAKRLKGKNIKVININEQLLRKVSLTDIFYASRNLEGQVVLIFDELDKTITGDRVAELQLCMGSDSHANQKRLIIFAMTNYPEKIPAALKRPGRFTDIVPVELPTYRDKCLFMSKQILERNITIPDAEKFFFELLKEMPKKTTLFELKKLIDDAYEVAESEGKLLNKEHVQRVFNSNIRKILPENFKTKKEKVIYATYQVGQAFMREILQTEKKTTCLTINDIKAKVRNDETNIVFANNNAQVSQNEKFKSTPPQQYTQQGKVFTTKISSKITTSDEEKLREVRVLLAGQQALKLILGTEYNNYMPQHNAKCLAILKNRLAQGESVTPEITARAIAELNEIKENVLVTLKKFKPYLEILAFELFSKNIMYQSEWYNALKSIEEKLRGNLSELEKTKQKVTEEEEEEETNSNKKQEPSELEKTKQRVEKAE